jgi:hypothetical protein
MKQPFFSAFIIVLYEILVVLHLAFIFLELPSLPLLFFTALLRIPRLFLNACAPLSKLLALLSPFHIFSPLHQFITLVFYFPLQLALFCHS